MLSFVYPVLLALHSFIRWLVLIGLLFAIYRAYRGWLFRKKYNSTDDRARFWVTMVVHTQLVIGLILYLVSPIVGYFLHHFKTAVHERQIRFFGMEHITVMLVAIVVISIGSAKAKRKSDDKEKFRTMAIWFTIGLLLILSSIPWSFSPLISRPNFRPF
jgi:hypothetical protein